MSRNRSIRLGRKSNGKKLITRNDLLPGEVICDKCDGKGWRQTDLWENQCEKCWGAGKVDWISHIMGAPPPEPRRLEGTWTMEMHKDIKAVYSYDLEKEMIDSISKELAEKIDEEIIGNIVEFSVTKSKLT